MFLVLEGGQSTQLNISISGFWFSIFTLGIFVFFGVLFYRKKSYTYLIAALMPALGYWVIYFILLEKSIWFLILLIGGIGILVGISKEYKGKDIALLLVVGIVLILISWLGYNLVYSGGETTIDSFGIGEGVTFPSGGESRTIIERSFGSLGNLLLIISVVTVLALLIYQKVKPIKGAEKKENIDKGKKKDLSSTVDEAISDLHSGKDVDSTILRCYYRMCSILEGEGAKNDDFMTPREFEMSTLREVDVPESTISELRVLFEMAKYSNHQLDEGHREKAVKDLKDLRKELGDNR